MEVVLLPLKDGCPGSSSHFLYSVKALYRKFGLRPSVLDNVDCCEGLDRLTVGVGGSKSRG